VRPSPSAVGRSLRRALQVKPGVVRAHAQSRQAKMKASGRAAALIVLGISAMAPSTGCATMVRSRDYSFDLTCLVVDRAGQPISGAEVVLKLGRAAYEVVTPIYEVRQTTLESGALVFMYITHSTSTPYVLKVKRAGYLAAEVRGEHRVEAGGTHLRITLVPETQKTSEE
jgi:hypothetical protein